MISIIYTILLFNILIIVFKMFEKYKIDNLQGLIFNYITAGICSYLFLESDLSLEYVINSDEEEDPNENGDYEWVPFSNPGNDFERIKKEN